MGPALFLKAHYKGTNRQAPVAPGIALNVRASWDHDWQHK